MLSFPALCYNVNIFSCRDWSELRSIFSGLFRGGSRHVDYADFLWAWHVINTRSVYYTHPVAAEGEPELSALVSSQGDRGDNEDNFALAPYLDLLNHTDTAQVSYGNWATLSSFAESLICIIPVTF